MRRKFYKGAVIARMLRRKPAEKAKEGAVRRRRPRRRKAATRVYRSIAGTDASVGLEEGSNTSLLVAGALLLVNSLFRSRPVASGLKGTIVNSPPEIIQEPPAEGEESSADIGAMPERDLQITFV